MTAAKGRVIRVVSDLPFGGVEKRLLALLPRLSQLGWEVLVCCIRQKGQMAPLFEKRGIDVHLVPFRSRWWPPSLFRLARFIADWGADIVHTHMYRSNTSGTVAARLAGVRAVVCNVHNVDEWDDRGQLLTDKLLRRHKEVIVAVSNRVRENYLARTGIEPEKVVTIYNGIEIEPFAKARYDPGLAAELGISPGEMVVSAFARLVEQKRHVDFLAMAKRILKRLAGTRFLVVGKGRLRATLEQKARELQIERQVIFAGHRDDIPRLLALTDVAVICSDKEGFSNSLLEAMAAGVPVVATDVGGNAEAVVDGQTGFIVPPRRPDLLAASVTKLLLDEKLRADFSNKARQRAQKFSIDTMARQTDELYTKLLAKAPKRRFSRAGQAD